MTVREVRTLLAAAGDAKPGLTGGIPNCHWAAPGERYVQVIGTDASYWAQSLPEVLRVIRRSGVVADSTNLRKLQEGAKLVEAGKNLNARQACSLFSRMLEVQGQPPGTSVTVTMVPSRANAKAVTAQACSAGAFTSVMLADQRGLDAPLPVEDIAKILKSVHRRNAG